MADQTPIEAAGAALLACAVAERHYTEGARTAVTAALAAVDVARVLREHNAARMECHDHEGLCCPAGDAHGYVDNHTHQAAALRAAILAAPECPICGSTTPGSTPSCDCDAHRDPGGA